MTALIVTGARMALLAEPGGEADAALLRDSVAALDSLDALIGLLVQRGRAFAPALAFCQHEADGVRLLVRGTAEVRVEYPDGVISTVSGARVTTWTEQFVDAGATLVLRLPRLHLEVHVLTADASPTAPPDGPVVPDRLPAGAAPAAADSASSVAPEVPAPDVPARGSRGDTAAKEQEPRRGTPGPAQQVPDRDRGEHPAAPVGPSPTPAAPRPSPIGRAAAPAAIHEDSVAFDFAHLVEETQFRGLEAAAVRPIDPERPAASGEEGAAASDPARTASQPVEAAAEAQRAGVPEELATSVEQSAGPARRDTTAPAAEGPRLIDTVPGGARRALPPLRRPTSGRTSSPVARAAPGAAAGRSRQDPDDAQDEDGLTVSGATVQALLREPSTQVARTPVQAVHCSLQHPSPPTADSCRTCGQPVRDRTVAVIERPVLGELHFADGRVEQLDTTLLLGRKPTAPAGTAVRVVQLDDPAKDLSRAHVEVRLEGWQVLLVDQDSTNKTHVELPGKTRQQLRPFDAFLVVPGTTVYLGDAARFSYVVPR